MKKTKDNTLFLKKLIEFTKTDYEVSWFDTGNLLELVIIIDNKVRIALEEVEIKIGSAKLIGNRWISSPTESYIDVDCDECHGSHHRWIENKYSNPIEAIIFTVQALEAIDLRHKMAEWLRKETI